MAYRYFSGECLPAALESPEIFTLGGDEAHHLLHVMRAKTGERIVLFDGSGAEFDAEIIALRKKELDVTLFHRRVVNRETPFPLVLAVALPKGDRQKWLVEKIVELGVAELWPLETEFSVAKTTDNAVERLRRNVLEASKQCGRNTLMKICEPISITTLLTDSERTAPYMGRFFAHLGTETTRISFPNGPCIAAFGPEGGFSDAEAEQAQSTGWTLATLGPRILRTETAAIALAARFS